MTEARDEGRLPAVETILGPPPVTSPPMTKPPIPVPDLFVVDFSSLLRSFDEADEVPAPVNGTPPSAVVSTTVSDPAPPGGVNDEDRTRYGVLLDRAAERGLLDPSEYQHGLEELAAATTVEEMNRIVTDLPVLSTARETKPVATRSRRSLRPPTATSTGTEAGVAVAPPRRFGLWIVMAVLVVVAVASLVIFALSVGRLSRSHSSGLPAVPMVPVVSPRL